MKKLEIQNSTLIFGGIGRAEYCGGLSSLLMGGGYQGDISYGMGVFWTNCGSYGYTLF